MMGSIMARKKQPFDLIYDPEVSKHLRAIESKHHGLIRTTIEEQLQYEPEVATRNRKPLRQPVKIGATWEIRFGPGNCFRVFYEVDEEQHEVRILAVGVKDRDRLLIAGEEVEL